MAGATCCAEREGDTKLAKRGRPPEGILYMKMKLHILNATAAPDVKLIREITPTPHPRRQAGPVAYLLPVRPYVQAAATFGHWLSLFIERT